MTISKLKKTLAIGLCITAVSSGVVFANQQDKEILPIRNTGEIDYKLIFENKPIENKGIRLMINNQWVEVDAAPFLENSRTIVPIRGIMEKLGAKVEWDAEKEAVRIIADNISIQLTIGEDTAKVSRKIDGVTREELVKLDVAPRLVGGSSFVPIRFVAEAIGAKVNWDPSSNIVAIDTEDKELNFGIERPIDYEILDAGSLEDQELIKWYNANSKNEGIYLYNEAKWQYVLVAAGEKPTGGYEMRINSLTQVSVDTAYFDAQLIAPGKDDFVTQALTYPSVLIRFEKTGEINVKGDVSQEKPGEVIEGEIGPSLSEMGKAIDIEAIKEMKLYSLMQEELKTFSKEESRDIVSKLNTSPTYDGPILMMLAGNSVTIKLEGQDSIQLTSYGNEEHVVVSGQIDGEHFGYCVVNNEIGKLLLEKY